MNVAKPANLPDEAFTLGRLSPVDIPFNQFLVEKFIGPSIKWLLGSHQAPTFQRQHQHAPIRPQQSGSHWETAWCILHMLSCWEYLSAFPAHQSICQDIKDRFNSESIDCNPLVWLCSEALVHADTTASWPGKEYDTAIVSHSLCAILTQTHLQVPSAIRDKVEAHCVQSQKWLRRYAFTRLRGSLTNDTEAPAVLEAILYSFQLPESLQAKMALKSESEDRIAFWECVDAWLSLLERRVGITPTTGPKSAQSASGSHSTNHDSASSLIGHDAVRCLCLMSEKADSSTTDKETSDRLKRCRRILSSYISALESDLRITRWGENLNRATKLGLYVRAYRASAASDAAPHTEVVLGALSLLMPVYFLNGSIYHNIYPTIYFLGSIVEVMKWEKAGHTLTALFSDCMDVFVDGLLPARLHSIALLNETISLRHELETQEEKAANSLKAAQEALASEQRLRLRLLWWLLNSIYTLVGVIVYVIFSPQSGVDSKLAPILVTCVLGLAALTYNHLKKD